MKKRKKRAMPQLILWDRRQQQRFVEAVERFVSLVGDLEVLLAAKKRRSAAAHKAHATRQAVPNAALLVDDQVVSVAHGEQNGGPRNA